jgi:hypothetical protein
MKLFLALLLVYFFILILNIAIGGLFIRRLRRYRNDLWFAWGQPRSVFAYKKGNMQIYRFIYSAKKHDFEGHAGLYRASKGLAFITALSQLGFLAAMIAFLAVAFSAKNAMA